MAGRGEEKRGAGGGLWRLPPLFLSIAGLLGTGGHVEALALSAFAILGITLLAFREPACPNTLALLTGLAAGLSWWSSLVSAPFLLAGSVLFPAARPRVLRTGIPIHGIGRFLIGSLPFWIWQIQHQWAAFHFFKGSGTHPFFENLTTVLWSSLLRSQIGELVGRPQRHSPGVSLVGLGGHGGIRFAASGDHSGGGIPLDKKVGWPAKALSTTDRFDRRRFYGPGGCYGGQ